MVTDASKFTMENDRATTEVDFFNLREVRCYILANFPAGSVVREMAGVLPDEVSYDEAAAILIALVRVIMRNRGDGA